MKELFNVINAPEIEKDFDNINITFYLKNFNTTLLLVLEGTIQNENSILILADKMIEIIKNSNFNKLEFKINLNSDEIKIKLAKKLLLNNYNVLLEETENKFTLDFNYKPFSYFIKLEIEELLNQLNINFSSFIFKNYLTNYLKYANVNKDIVVKSLKNITNFGEKKLLNKYKDKLSASLNLKFLPKTKDELDCFSTPKVKLFGEIFDLEVKELKNNKKLYLLYITDYQESCLIKFFSENTLDFSIGDSLEVSGVITFDTFINKIVVISDDDSIKKISLNYKNKINLDSLHSEKERMRTELHIHSNFSTQDGVETVENYFKNAKNFGVSSLAFVDHENVQAFPQIEACSKKYDVKAIYGCELNLVDDSNFKIYYQNNSSKNFFVGLDIETTGFSSVYDEITEISAYKKIDNKIYEYNVLVKIKDKKLLSKKISNLTSITNEMLEKDGIDIKEALTGLINFIDDGIIVAHNGKFDVDFIEYKIKNELNIEKHYSFIDTLNFSRVILEKENMKRFSLDKVCSKLKIELNQHHRAIYDAMACFNIFFKLLEKIEDTETTIDDVNSDELIETKIKVISKKQKEELLQFVQNTNIAYNETNLSTTSRINSIFTFNTIGPNSLLLKEFLIKNPKIKIISISKKDFAYSSDLTKLNSLINLEHIIKYQTISHTTVLIKNQIGLKEFYKLLSLSNTKRITNRGNVVLLSDLNNPLLRQNILLGSSCVNGLFKTIYEKGLNYAIKQMFPYDYFEIQPLNCYLSVSDSYNKKENIVKTVTKLLSFCKENGKIIVCDTDAHYINPSLKNQRDIFISTFGVGGVMHPLFGKEDTGINSFLSTNTLINTIKNDYNLDTIEARHLVVKNAKTIDMMISDDIKIVPDKLYTPNDDFLSDKVLDVVGHTVPSVKEEFERIVDEASKAYAIDGRLPSFVKKRLDKEMASIIGHGYYIIYYIAYLLVKKSNSDGYVVGSRGSVGSSFVATMMKITEVNPLPPHYYCPKCHFQVYKGVEDIFKNIKSEYRQAVENVQDGFDLPVKRCPICGEILKGDGHDIPFETFLGFNGDKTPDIDLNFSGDYQSKAHDFCKEVFGEKHAFRAGTISTVASKTAELYARKYFEKNNIQISDAEIYRQSVGLRDVKRTTGQHPGGIIVIPSNMEIEDFTPIQYPANQVGDWYTTHLDYNAIHENVLKMDILGHDDPTILKFLMDLVKENPDDYPFKTPQQININDEKIISFLNKNSSGIVESLGIPEFGTKFVQGMLNEINPKSFSDLVKVSGLSHGTDVWNNNAQDLVNGSTKFGIIPFSKIIGCRDDIMVHLIYFGLEPKDAFNIMEFVRKGKMHKDPKEKETWEKFKKIMLEKNVPQWYIYSCEQIKYMFPKAHAVAYVLSALRIAWFKAYKPLEFYQALFTIRCDSFDIATIITNNCNIIVNKIEEINSNKDSTDIEKKSVVYLEIAKEMIEKGFRFKAPNLKLSHKTVFLKYDDKTLLIPFKMIDGVGIKTAESVYANRGNIFYKNIDDLKLRGKADKKFIEGLKKINALEF